jgi:hypothetical protein
VDVIRQLLSLSVNMALYGGVSYLWSRADGWWTLIAIPFAAMAAFSALILIAVTLQLLRGRHPVQSPERAVCNECGKVKMPWAMEAHLRGSGHEAAGAHLR